MKPLHVLATLCLCSACATLPPGPVPPAGNPVLARISTSDEPSGDPCVEDSEEEDIMDAFGLRRPSVSETEECTPVVFAPEATLGTGVNRIGIGAGALLVPLLVFSPSQEQDDVSATD
ncbi:MAG: hypothetical protein AAFP13_11800 [Pseudomonadota bacterium]